MADQVRASHILLTYEGAQNSSATRSKAEALAEIKSLRADINRGSDFAELAIAHSECPSSRKGGDLGIFGHGMMVPEFEEATYGMEVGGLSEVVETSFGYHLITRTE